MNYPIAILRYVFRSCALVILAIILLTLPPQESHAATILGNVADNGIYGPATGTTVLDSPTPTGTTLQLGRISPTWINDIVFVFQLPTLQAGESIGSATLTFQVTSASGTAQGTGLGANVDLYGLTSRSTSTVNTSDYYVGANDTTATLVQDNLFTAGVSIAAGSYSTSGSSNLASYLNAEITASGNAGYYAFLRLNEDAFNVQNNIYVAMADNANSSYIPIITYTVVPEPGAFILLLLGMFPVAIFAWKRTSAGHDS